MFSCDHHVLLALCLCTKRGCSRIEPCKEGTCGSLASKLKILLSQQQVQNRKQSEVALFVNLHVERSTEKSLGRAMMFFPGSEISRDVFSFLYIFCII